MSSWDSTSSGRRKRKLTNGRRRVGGDMESTTDSSSARTSSNDERDRERRGVFGYGSSCCPRCGGRSSTKTSGRSRKRIRSSLSWRLERLAALVRFAFKGALYIAGTLFLLVALAKCSV